ALPIYRFSRTTEGTGMVCRALWRKPSPSVMQTAFAVRTRIAARRTDTTHSGSYVALRTKEAGPAVGRMSGIASHPLDAFTLPVSRSHVPGHARANRASPARHSRPCANRP